MSDLKLTPDDIYALARGCRVTKPKLREATEYEISLAQEVERLTSENKDIQELYEDASAAGMALGVKYAELQTEVAALKDGGTLRYYTEMNKMLAKEIAWLKEQLAVRDKVIAELKIDMASTFHGGPWEAHEADSLGYDQETKQYCIQRFRVLKAKNDGTYYDSDEIKFLSKDEAESIAAVLNRASARRTK